MTIRGFRSLLERDMENFTKKFRLSDTKILVDGDNFLVELFSILSMKKGTPGFRGKIYGGDMVELSKGLREVIEKMRKCNIEPIFIFNGAVPDETILEKNYPIRIDNYTRAQNCIANVTQELGESEDAGSSACAILMKATAKMILDDLGVERRRTGFVCDKYVCKLSFELKCPILSSDSDYFLMETYMGFILNKEIIKGSPIEKQPEPELQQQTNGDHNGENNELTSSASSPRSSTYELECNLFCRDKLFTHFPGLTKEMIPLFGAMLDSSYLKPNISNMLLEPLAQNVNLGSSAGGDVKIDHEYHDYTQAQRKILKLLHHISLFDQPRLALKSLIDRMDEHHFRNPNTPNLYQLIQRRLIIWSLDDQLESNTIKNLERLYPDFTSEDGTKVIDRSHIREYLLDLVHNDHLSSRFTEIIFRTLQYERPYVEVLRWQSPNLLKKRLYSIVLALTRSKSLARMNQAELDIAASRDVCRVYDRCSARNYTEIRVVPLSKLNDEINLDEYDIEKLMCLDASTARCILLGAFYSTIEDWNQFKTISDRLFKYDYSYNACICFIIIKYVILESKMDITNLIDAILLTLVYYAAENGQLDVTNNETIDLNQTVSRELQQLLSQVEDPVATNKFPPDFNTHTHKIAMFNVGLWGFINVNSILKSPMGTVRTDLFMNSRIVYLFSVLSSTSTTSPFPETIKQQLENERLQLIELIPQTKRRVITPPSQSAGDATEQHEPKIMNS